MSMITKYFQSVKIKFDPFAPSARAARLFLARLPTHAKVDLKLLPKGSADASFLEITFKDKKVIQADLETMNITSIGEKLNAHSRLLKIADAIKD